MNTLTRSLLQCAAAAALSFVLIPASSVEAALLTDWTPASPDNFVGGDTASPAFVGTAVGTMWADFDDVTLEVGGKLTLSGKVTFTGLPASLPQEINSGNFTWGIYHDQGSATRFGWWGYAPGNARNDGRGQLFRSIVGNKEAFNVGAHSTSVKTGLTSGGPLISDTYTFTLVYERNEAGLQVSWSLVGEGASNPYQLASTYFEANEDVHSWIFNRVGISARSGSFGNGNSTGAQYENLSLVYSSIPEGTAAALFLGGGALLVYSKRFFGGARR